MKINLGQIQRQTDLTSTGVLNNKTSKQTKNQTQKPPTFFPAFFMSLGAAIIQSSSRAFLCYTICSCFFTFLSYWCWRKVLDFFYSRILIFSCTTVFLVPQTIAEKSIEFSCYNRQKRSAITSDMQTIILYSCIMGLMEISTLWESLFD